MARIEKLGLVYDKVLMTMYSVVSFLSYLSFLSNENPRVSKEAQLRSCYNFVAETNSVKTGIE